MAAVRAVLVDIEGTTSSISFVHDVLFPYAREALPGFVRAHGEEPAVRKAIEGAAAEAGLDPANREAIITTLVGWIDADRKATPLKTLQGMIWERGYREGAFRAHLYPDAAPALAAWHAAGFPVYVYSSGSIHAQKLFFGHSEAGDLTHLFSGWFDTTSGGKRDAASYAGIAQTLALAPETIVFLSDVPEELDAARTAGLLTVWVIREEEGRYSLSAAANSAHPAIGRLTDLDIAALG